MDHSYTLTGTKENKIFLSAIKKMGTNEIGFAYMVTKLKAPMKSLCKDFDLTEEEKKAVLEVEKYFK